MIFFLRLSLRALPVLLVPKTQETSQVIIHFFFKFHTQTEILEGMYAGFTTPLRDVRAVSISDFVE